MKIFKTGKTEWIPKHETFVQNIKDLYEVGNEPALAPLEAYNDTTKGIQKLIGDAINNNYQLRAIGAAWSWSGITVADQGIIIDTKPLNTIFEITPQSVVPSYKGDINKLFFAQCGNAVWELSSFLKKRNLSLKTSGASNGQTIAGVLATGAHGSAFDFGAVQEFVVGLHIIVGPNRHVYLQRKSSPVASANFINKLNTELIEDDDLFNAALVHLGGLGFVHGVMIETEDIFLLECYMQRMPYDAALKKTMEKLDFNGLNLPCGNERPFHFEVKINPYDMAGGAYVTTMYKRPYKPDYPKPAANAAGIGPGDDAACFVGKLTQTIPALVPSLVNKLLAGALTPFSKVYGTLGEIFDNTTLHGRLISTAIGIPVSQVTRVTDIMLELNKTKGPFLGLFAFRFVKKSDASLAFTRHDSTCVFELDGAFSDTMQSFFNEVWKRLDQEQIPHTYHWGKMSNLDFDKLSNMYDDGLNQWLKARNKLLDKDTMKVFTNPIMKQWGLDKVLN
jgi:FAD/FMN-containing dehydrogenase